jgi:hypothetical protein
MTVADLRRTTYSSSLSASLGVVLFANHPWSIITTSVRPDSIPTSRANDTVTTYTYLPLAVRKECFHYIIHRHSLHGHPHFVSPEHLVLVMGYATALSASLPSVSLSLA